jgi:anti-sigma-K factor RskA
MEHQEMLDLVPLYAIDALEGTEMEEFEAHLETCEECVADLAAHHAVTAALIIDQEAPAQVWDRITVAIGGGGPSDVPRLHERRTARRRPLAWIASVAAIAALLLGSLAVFQAIRLNDVAGPGGILAAAQAVAETPGAIVADLDSPTGKVAQVILGPGGEGFLIPAELEPLPDDRTYQLWVITPDQDAISAGVLGNDPGPVRFTWSGDVAGFALTREVAGGVPSTAGDVVSTVEI